jgi:hypothetical protein
MSQYITVETVRANVAEIKKIIFTYANGKNIVNEDLNRIQNTRLPLQQPWLLCRLARERGKFHDVVACRGVTRQRPRDKQIYQSQ